MSVLVVVERQPGGVEELSLQALTFARAFAGGDSVEALVVGDGGDVLAATLGEHGVSTLHVAEHEVFRSYAPPAVAQAAVELAERLQPAAIAAAGSERGNEVLAHVAARLDVPFAANCIAATPGDPARVTRLRWGGSLLEEADVHGSPTLLTVAPHVVAAEPARVGEAAVERFAPTLSESDQLVRVTERTQADSGGVSLAEAKVVVSSGRGAGSAEGFGIIEEADVHGSPTLLTVAPHVVAAEPAPAGEAAVERFAPTLSESDQLVRVTDRTQAEGGGASLAEAKVVVSSGRGAGSAEGFGIIEELAGLLGGAVGCSRAVTMAGWRPHTDQVGQTGTKIAPDIYIACGISGATQHMAGCKGAKTILAVNTDPEAPILASADYAVIGDLHEVVPAISAELRKVRAA